MCGTSATVEQLLLVHEAALVAEDVLGPLAPEQFSKALKLGSPRGFDRAVALLAAKLRRATGSADMDAVRAAVSVLDVDWRNTTAEQRRRLVAESLRTAGRAVALVPERIQFPLGDAANSVVAAARADVRRGQGLAIAADLNALDRRVVSHVASSQGNFVRDEYGRRLEAFGQEARRVVADGLKRGLGRDELAGCVFRLS